MEGAGWVQENGPERLDLKRELFQRLDEAAPADAVLATSSSTITVSEIQDACARHPERVVLGHPFNPPHLIPLVEVAGGRATAAEAVERALALGAEYLVLHPGSWKGLTREEGLEAHSLQRGHATATAQAPASGEAA